MQGDGRGQNETNVEEKILMIKQNKGAGKTNQEIRWHEVEQNQQVPKN